MRTLTLSLGDRSYDIVFGDAFINMRAFIERGGYKKIALVTDSNVDSLYGVQISSALADLDLLKIVLPAGESSKSEENLSRLYSEMLDFQMTRADLIIALGGGVVGDIAGFCAATLLRGLDYLQVPTTLLAQVDSSVGGKVAINVKQGKNLVGSFYQPKGVLIDSSFLKSLPERVFSDGMAEVIKYGAIADEQLFSALESGEFDMDEVIYTCCDIKRRIVEEDEHDTGCRMKLNFGHTLGHAIEQRYQYSRYTHGEAVAIGMRAISAAGVARGLTQAGTTERLESVLKRYQLPIRDDAPISELAKAMNLDKKAGGGSVRLILLERIGAAKIYPIPTEETESFFSCTGTE